MHQLLAAQVKIRLSRERVGVLAPRPIESGEAMAAQEHPADCRHLDGAFNRLEYHTAGSFVVILFFSITYELGWFGNYIASLTMSAELIEEHSVYWTSLLNASTEAREDIMETVCLDVLLIGESERGWGQLTRHLEQHGAGYTSRKHRACIEVVRIVGEGFSGVMRPARPWRNGSSPSYWPKSAKQIPMRRRLRTLNMTISWSWSALRNTTSIRKASAPTCPTTM